jgi:excinuclease UvrABC helicase subunit UvrB
MKRIFFFTLTLLTLSFSVNAQEVVQWSATYNTDLSQIEIKATIKEGWHLYSQHIDNNVGPVPTQFSFQSSDNFQLKGAVIEPQAIQKYDENFEATLDFFEHEVTFIQKIDVFRKTTLEGEVTFMVCDETMCLPPVDRPIKIELLPKNQ